jgi:hypothetical protein
MKVPLKYRVQQCARRCDARKLWQAVLKNQLEPLFAGDDARSIN